MVTGHDLAIVDLVRIDIPQEKPRLVGILPLHPKLLIEIAIINLSAPSHADGVAAHEAVDGCRVERADEQLHVFLEIVVVSQISGKAPDRKIRDRVEVVEHDAEICRELAFEIRLQVGLRTR